MLVSFPLQGYALFSIIFSTMFLFASYGFVWFFVKYSKKELKKTNSYKLIKAALWYLVLSSLGPWALGAIMNTLGAGSIWYRMAIYFYLHFQYNGWMIMALLGLCLFVMERNQIMQSNQNFIIFFWSLNLGIILSFFLSTLFADPPILFNILGGVGAMSQLIALVFLLIAFVPELQRSRTLLSPSQNRLLKTVAVLLGVKMLLQLPTSFSYFADLATTYLDFTIGYLHWTFLGVISTGLFLLLDCFKLIRVSKMSYFLYFFGFVLTEVLIFYKAIVAWQHLKLFDGYFEVLAVVSLLIPLSLVLMLAIKRRETKPDHSSISRK